MNEALDVIRRLLAYDLDDNQLCEPCEGQGREVLKGGDHLPGCIYGAAEGLLKRGDPICVDCSNPRSEHTDANDLVDLMCPGQIEAIDCFTDRFPR